MSVHGMAVRVGKVSLLIFLVLVDCLSEPFRSCGRITCTEFVVVLQVWAVPSIMASPKWLALHLMFVCLSFSVLYFFEPTFIVCFILFVILTFNFVCCCLFLYCCDQLSVENHVKARKTWSFYVFGDFNLLFCFSPWKESVWFCNIRLNDWIGILLRRCDECVWYLCPLMWHIPFCDGLRTLWVLLFWEWVLLGWGRDNVYMCVSACVCVCVCMCVHACMHVCVLQRVWSLVLE